MNCKFNQVHYAACLSPTLYWKRFCVCYPCWEVTSLLLDRLQDCAGMYIFPRNIFFYLPPFPFHKNFLLSLFFLFFHPFRGVYFSEKSFFLPPPLSVSIFFLTTKSFFHYMYMYLYRHFNIFHFFSHLAKYHHFSYPPPGGVQRKNIHPWEKLL